jgi:UDP-glucose 4-epimerase
VRSLVTGSAGFIGSNLVDRLLAGGHEVIGFDNLSTGRLEFLDDAVRSPNFTFRQGDLLDQAALEEALPGVDIVFHFAANADVRYGTQHPGKDLRQNTVGTLNVLEAMRHCGVRRIAAASSGSVYGDATVFPTPEEAPFPLQTSLYGASKMATEGFISAYVRHFGFQAWIFRFVSILGERYTHGHVFDFYRQLRAHPAYLEVLGDGQQKKSYLYVQDCIDAILLSLKSESPINIFNFGTDEFALVDNSIRWICEELGISPKISYSGGERGWIGDSPFILLECARIRSLGWAPKLSIREGVVRTLRFLVEHSEFLSDCE